MKKKQPQGFILGKWMLVLFLISPGVLYGQPRGMRVVARTPEGKEVPLYNNSYALVVGVSDYTSGWPDLPNAVKDAQAVADALRKAGFIVKSLFNPTSRQLNGAIDDLEYSMGSANDRLIFYFAGHGETETLQNKKELGYIVPADAPLIALDKRGFQEKAISMLKFELNAKRVPVKHALYIFDSCFSGSIFSLSRAAPKVIQENTALPTRQFITAGDKDEAVPDESVFTPQLIRGLLQREADLSQDGYVTATELGAYLRDSVVNYSNGAQHPQYGKIRDPELDRGDFVFVVSRAETMTSSRIVAPVWFSNPPRKPGYMYAIGISDRQCSTGDAIRQADERARALMSLSYAANIQGLTKDFEQGFEGRASIRFFSQTCRITSPLLARSSIKIVDRYFLTDGVVISLAELPRDRVVVVKDRHVIIEWRMDMEDNEGLYRYSLKMAVGNREAPNTQAYHDSYRDSTGTMVILSECPEKSKEKTNVMFVTGTSPQTIDDPGHVGVSVIEFNGEGELASAYLQAWVMSNMKLASSLQVKVEGITEKKNLEVVDIPSLSSASKSITSITLSDLAIRDLNILAISEKQQFQLLVEMPDVVAKRVMLEAQGKSVEKQRNRPGTDQEVVEDGDWLRDRKK